MVSVHFAPGGGRYPVDDETDEPDGYAVVGFDSTGTDRETARPAHGNIVASLGDWLTERGLRWF